MPTTQDGLVRAKNLALWHRRIHATFIKSIIAMYRLAAVARDVDIYDMSARHFCGYRGVRRLTTGSARRAVAVTASDPHF